MATIPVSGGGQALQQAINSASSGDVLVVGDGTYDAVVVNKSLAIRSANGRDHCIIDGKDEKRCVTRTGGDVDLYGLTLENGRTESGDGQNASGNGGGVTNVRSVHDCRFLDCYASNTGGAIYINADRSVVRTEFERCKSGSHGGVSVGCRFIDCTMTSCVGGNWGVIMDCYGVLRCSVIGCSCASHLLHANNKAGSIVACCQFRDNAMAAATRSIVSDHRVFSCLFVGNSGGRGIASPGIIANNTFIGNSFASGNDIYFERVAGWVGNLPVGGRYCANNLVYDGRIGVAWNSAKDLILANNVTKNAIYVDTNSTGVSQTGNARTSNVNAMLDEAGRPHMLSDMYGFGDPEYLPDERDITGREYRAPVPCGCYSPPMQIPTRTNPFGL